MKSEDDEKSLREIQPEKKSFEDNLESKVNRRDAYCAVAGCFIVHFFYGGLLKSLTIFYPFWQLLFQVDNTEVSIIFSALSCSMQFGAFLSKYTMGYNLRRTFCTCAALSASGGILGSLVNDLWSLAGAIAIIGFGLGLFRVRSISIASQSFSAEKRAMALGFALVGTPLGSAILPALWRFLLYNYTVKQTLLIMAGLLLNMFIAALLLQEPQIEKEEKKKNEPDHWKQIYSFPMILFQCSMFLTFTGKLSQFPFLVPFAESIGLTDYQPATILFGMNIVDIFGRPFGGWLSGLPPVRKFGQSYFLAFFIGCLGLLNLLSGIIIQDYDSFLIWAILFGLIYSLPVSTQIASIAEFTDVKNMNSVLSVNALILLFGVLLAPLVNGALVDITKSYRSTFYLAGAFLASASLLVVIAKLSMKCFRHAKK